MNIDPKSEIQKPDFDKIARLKFDTEHSRPDDGNEMRAYRQGLEDGYNTLQSENQRLTEENNWMLESVGSINAVMDELEELRTYKNANSWISSKDQLPDIIDGKHGGFVWAWDSNYEQGHEEFYTKVRTNPLRWTHWMHLPEPPKPLNHEQS